MSDDAPLLELCADLVRRAQAAGAEHAEAYLEVTSNRTVEVNQGALESVTSATGRGVGLRVILGDRVGYVSGTDLDPAGRADLAAHAVALARAGAPDPFATLPGPSHIPTADLAIYDPTLDDLPLNAALELIRRTEQAAYATDSRVDGTHIARFGQSVDHIAIVSSRGVSGRYSTSSCYVSLSVIAREGGEAQRGHSSMTAHTPGGLDTESVGARAGQRATMLLGAAPMTTRRASVIFEPDVIAEMLRTLAQALSGDAVARGRSLFAARDGAPGWIGSLIGSPVVDLVDDGSLPGAPSSAPFDGEGVPTQRTPLIEGGVLRGFLHNAESAGRSGATSTGNGVRTSHRVMPEVGQTNLVLEPGTRPLAALIGEIEDGLYVVTTRNVGGINPVSGDYSVGASGRRIVRGELGEPVSGVTVAAPILDLLRNIREVGSDPRWVSGQTGYCGVPSVLIDDVTIGGL